MFWFWGNSLWCWLIIVQSTVKSLFLSLRFSKNVQFSEQPFSIFTSPQDLQLTSSNLAWSHVPIIRSRESHRLPSDMEDVLFPLLSDYCVNF